MSEKRGLVVLGFFCFLFFVFVFLFVGFFKIFNKDLPTKNSWQFILEWL